MRREVEVFVYLVGSRLLIVPILTRGVRGLHCHCRQEGVVGVVTGHHVWRLGVLDHVSVVFHGSE